MNAGASLPELPDAKRKRYEAHGITPYNASVLTAEVETARSFDALLGSAVSSQRRRRTGWFPICSAPSTGSGKSIEDSPVSATQAAELLGLVADGTISGTIAKKVFEIDALDQAAAPREIVEREGLKQTSDTGEIDARIDEILAANVDKVEQYKAGKEALFGFFVGQTMKAMAGKANPQLVNERLRAKHGLIS